VGQAGQAIRLPNRFSEVALFPHDLLQIPARRQTPPNRLPPGALLYVNGKQRRPHGCQRRQNDPNESSHIRPSYPSMPNGDHSMLDRVSSVKGLRHLGR